MVGGGDVSWGVGGVGVLKRVLTTWEEGGGVMLDVVRGAGDVNFTRSGEATFDMVAAAADSERDAERNVGVSGRVTSVEGTSSCDGWWSDAWLSMLPGRKRCLQAMRDTSDVRGRQGQCERAWPVCR